MLGLPLLFAIKSPLDVCWREEDAVDRIDGEVGTVGGEDGGNILLCIN